jgi:hypothetical protein
MHFRNSVSAFNAGIGLELVRCVAFTSSISRQLDRS